MQHKRINGIPAFWVLLLFIGSRSRYHMWETMAGKNYYLGAAWGEWHDPNPNGKGDGEFMYIDPDRSCWTTASVIGNQTKMDVDGDLITIDELYQWRLVSEEEFISLHRDNFLRRRIENQHPQSSLQHLHRENNP